MKLAKLNDKPEVFFTLQGEGRNLGKPSIFVRTSLCNLHCVWCDTPYTWNWNNTPFSHVENKKFDRNEQIVELSPQELAVIIKTHDCNHIVLTGGEPLIQQQELAELVIELKKSREYTFEVETNGTLIPSYELSSHIDQFNVSPKLSNAKMDQKIRLKPKALESFASSTKSYFKFVVANPSDLEEILDLTRNYSIAPERVYLMPEGTSVKSLSDKMPFLIESCMKHGFNLTQRMHIELFGNRRGV